MKWSWCLISTCAIHYKIRDGLDSSENDDKHLRNSLPAQGRLGQRGERLYSLWCDLFRPKLRLGQVVSPLSHFSVAIHNIPILL